MTSIDELELPKTLVHRLIKNQLPEGAQVNKDAKAAFSKAATVFVSYLASTSQEICTAQRQRTLLPKHVFKALEMMHLHELVPGLRSLYNSHTIRKKQKKDKKEAAKDIEEMGIELAADDDDDEEPAPVEEDLALEEDPSSTADNKRKAEEELANSPNKQPKIDE